jgi:hypothetical protein
MIEIARSRSTVALRLCARSTTSGAAFERHFTQRRVIDLNRLAAAPYRCC